jgi:hypothetical protein
VTTLPAHRRIINGRTFSRSWTPADYDPLPKGWVQSDTHRDRVLSVLLASVIGIALGALVAIWITT